MKKLVFSLLVSSQIAFANKGEITLSSAIEVSPRDKITAYDLIESKNISEDILADLKDIELAGSETRTISKVEIIKKFQGINSNFRLPAEIKILRSKSNVSRLELERKIKNHLLAKCGACEYKVQINSVPQNLQADWEMDLNVDFNKSTVMIPISSSDNKGWITVAVKKYANIPVLNRPLKIGDTITEDVLTLDKRQISNYQEIMTDTKSLLGFQAARFLTAGQALSARDLKREMVLKRGQMVKAIFGDESFEVSISAQAEEGGAIGDVIKVKNLDSQKMFAAKIVERGVVKIE